FRHALYREVVYDQLPAARRIELHRRIGERVEAGYGPRAGAIATGLAMHFQRGREGRRAVQYLLRAGQVDIRRSAPREAVNQLTTALDLLRALPDGPDPAQQEIAAQIALGGQLVATRGWGAPEVEAAYARAQALCRDAGDTPQLFPAVWGLWLFRWGRGELAAALELGEGLLRQAERSADARLVVQGHHALWVTRFVLGDLTAARDHVTRGLAPTTPDADGSLLL